MREERKKKQLHRPAAGKLSTGTWVSCIGVSLFHKITSFIRFSTTSGVKVLFQLHEGMGSLFRPKECVRERSYRGGERETQQMS